MGFLPTNDVRRVVTYAVDHGRHRFAALVPRSAYGDIAFDAFKAAVADTKAELGQVERFAPTEDGGIQPAMGIARTDADALFIPQGGAPLRAIAPALGTAGLDPEKTRLLGTGTWNDPANLDAPSLDGAWFAAPDPKDEVAFNAKFRGVFGSNPPQLASLAYDAVALVAVLAKGEAYHRFTREALTDPNGFDGIDGIFRFNADGTNERGLAILAIRRDGFRLVDPAPTSFVKPGS
jgi:ABC-type branched-subunit amino acid transport system substrate-binding protein